MIAARVHPDLQSFAVVAGVTAAPLIFQSTSQRHRDRAGTICLYSGRTLARLVGTDRSI